MTDKSEIKMTVNRANFMAYIGDDTLYKKAEEVMDEGGIVGLTDANGNIISIMSVIDEFYEEQLID